MPITRKAKPYLQIRRVPQEELEIAEADYQAEDGSTVSIARPIGWENRDMPQVATAGFANQLLRSVLADRPRDADGQTSRQRR